MPACASKCSIKGFLCRTDIRRFRYGGAVSFENLTTSWEIALRENRQREVILGGIAKKRWFYSECFSHDPIQRQDDDGQ
jgi:hypothetical protein